MGEGNDLNWAKQHLYSSLALTSPKLFGSFLNPIFKLPDFLQSAVSLPLVSPLVTILYMGIFI